MENIDITPPFPGEFLRNDVPPLTIGEERRLGKYRAKTINEKLRKISRHTFPFIKDHIIPLDEFDINKVHLNRVYEVERLTNSWIFPLLYGENHDPIFLETKGNNSRFLKKIKGIGKNKGLHINLRDHESQFSSILEQLSSQETLERLVSDIPIVQVPLEYKICQLSLSHNEETYEYEGEFFPRLELSRETIVLTPAYDLSLFENPNYNLSIRSKNSHDYVNNYRHRDRFSIRAIIYFPCIRIANQAVRITSFVKEFGYSRM